MKQNFTLMVITINYVFAVVTTIFLMVTGTTDSLLNYLYGVLFLGFIPVVAGVYGLITARQWGFFKSVVGKALVFLSLGLISWGMGTYIFSGVYNLILHVEVPYPSFADVGYVLALPLWAIGMVQLSRATGAKYSLRSLKGKMMLLAIPLLIIIISYYLLIIVARAGSIDFSGSGMFKIFFDLIYPIGDVVILTFAIVIFGLSYDYLGGIFKGAIKMILFGFVLLYLADFSFSYTTTLERFQVGHWVDLLFTTSMFILAMGIVRFNSAKKITTSS